MESNYIIKNDKDKGIVEITIPSIAKCKASIDESTNTWTISEWFVNRKCQSQGIGTKILKATLNELLNTYNKPNTIKYIWNGQNEYVHNWLQKKFSPINMCSLYIQKNSFDDDWSSHMYNLDVGSVLDYISTYNLDNHQGIKEKDSLVIENYDKDYSEYLSM